jgi:hypothetical protein
MPDKPKRPPGEMVAKHVTIVVKEINEKYKTVFGRHRRNTKMIDDLTKEVAQWRALEEFRSENRNRT